MLAPRRGYRTGKPQSEVVGQVGTDVAGSVPVVPVGDAGVVVTEQLEVVDTQVPARGAEFGQPGLGHLAGVVAVGTGLHAVGAVAELPVGARRHNGLHTPRA